MELGFPSWVGVVCEDLDAQRRFDENVLKMRVVGEGVNWIHFDLGTGPEFELLHRSTEPQYDAARYQVGFAVEDIEATRRELIDRGVTPISDVLGTRGLGRWVYFKDPEGNVFEIKEAADPARGCPRRLHATLGGCGQRDTGMASPGQWQAVRTCQSSHGSE